jgi:hypothetical protein
MEIDESRSVSLTINETTSTRSSPAKRSYTHGAPVVQTATRAQRQWNGGRKVIEVVIPIARGRHSTSKPSTGTTGVHGLESGGSGLDVWGTQAERYVSEKNNDVCEDGVEDDALGGVTVNDNHEPVSISFPSVSL